MKSGGVARAEHTSRLSVTCPIAATCCKFRNHRLVGGHHHEKQVNRLNYAGFKTSRTGCDQKTLEEKKTSCKKTAVQNILQIHYSQAESLWTQHVMSKCFKAFTPQWLSDEICKKEKNLTECPQNIVLPQVFCFPAILQGFSLTRNYKCVWIFDGRSHGDTFASSYRRNSAVCKLCTAVLYKKLDLCFTNFFLDAHMFKLHAQSLGVCYMECVCIIALIYCVLCDF